MADNKVEFVVNSKEKVAFDLMDKIMKVAPVGNKKENILSLYAECLKVVEGIPGGNIDAGTF